jgi:quinoprotein glucose dehydrogenase
VPTSDVPGEWTSPTQPFPTKPAAYDRQGFSEDDLIDFTPEIRAAALASIGDLRMGPIYSPLSLVDAGDGTRGRLMLPSFGGGANWEGGAADPETGMLYVGSVTSPVVGALRPDPEFTDIRYVFVNGEVPQPMDLPLARPPWGRITAIDMNTGEHAWMVATGAGDRIRNHPRLKALNLPPLGGDVSYSGPLLTKTLLIYALTTGGSNGGPRLVAYNKATGAELASADLPAVAIGTPMTYLVNGKQYIALTVQGRSQGEVPELVALALP